MRPSLACVSLAAAVLLHPAPARACSCQVGFNATLPADGAIDVPTNTKIWIDGVLDCNGYPSEMAPRLLDPDGADVPFTMTCLNSGNFYVQVLVLHPDAPLLPDTTYTVQPPTQIEFQFTTGAGTDDTPPEIPVEVDRAVEHTRAGPRDTCFNDAEHWATLTVTGEAALFVLDAGETTDLDPVAVAGTVAEVTAGDVLFLGSTACHGDNFPGGASRRAETTIRYGAFDLAGNFSGWSDPDPLSLGGCSVAPRSPAWWLLLLPLIGRRRRLTTPSRPSPGASACPRRT